MDALPPAGGRAGHDARDVRGPGARRPRHAPGAGRRHRHRASPRRRRPTSTLNAFFEQARGPGRALRRRRLRGQGDAHRRRPRGLLQGQPAAVPGARAGQHRIRGARPRRGEEGHRRQRGGPARPTTSRTRARFGTPGRAPRQPHPDRRAARARRPPTARRPRPRPRNCWPQVQEGARQLRRRGHEELAGPGLGAPTAATSTSSRAAR